MDSVEGGNRDSYLFKDLPKRYEDKSPGTSSRRTTAKDRQRIDEIKAKLLGGTYGK